MGKLLVQLFFLWHIYATMSGRCSIKAMKKIGADTQLSINQYFGCYSE